MTAERDAHDRETPDAERGPLRLVPGLPFPHRSDAQYGYGRINTQVPHDAAYRAAP